MPDLERRVDHTFGIIPLSMILVALLVIVVCCWMAWRSWRNRAEAQEWFDARDVPPGAVTIGQDLMPDPRWAGRISLVDPATGLRGRIDQLLRTRDGALVPSEIKLAHRLPPAPHDKDEIQLGVYFLLCARDRRIAREPAYGLLHYRDMDGTTRAFRVDNTPALRDRVLATLRALRAADGTAGADIRRSHAQPGRCRGCGWAEWCEDRLA
jgi:CRISPR/Cas system-associated exonuclease Cas4 (RecB family)